MKIATHDGLSLNVFATEITHRTTIVFVNALGIGSTVTEELAAALFRRGYNFVTWNGRGFPGDYDENFRTYDTSDQVRDLVAVAEHLGLGPIVLSAWCTGIHTALLCASQHRLPIESLVLFNSPNYFNTRLSGVGGDAIGKVSELLVKDEHKLDFLYTNIFAHNTEQVQVTMTGVTDRRLQELVQAPFKSGPEALLRYAHLIKNTSTVKLTSESCRHITQPTLIVGGRCDTMVSFEDSIRLSNMLPGSAVRIFDTWNHYSLFSDVDTVADEVFAEWLTDWKSYAKRMHHE